jgi:hypothetical protein
VNVDNAIYLKSRKVILIILIESIKPCYFGVKWLRFMKGHLSPKISRVFDGFSREVRLEGVPRPTIHEYPGIESWPVCPDLCIALSKHVVSCFLTHWVIHHFLTWI